MIFQFKKFAVDHTLSAHKVGVDGVLLGAWAQCFKTDSPRILDVGCGCGLIALMMAQRYPTAQITAIDIHEPSVEEAHQNILNSPWADHIQVIHTDFDTFCADNVHQASFDLVVSNPPYFNSGVDATTSERMTARHCGALSPIALVEKGPSLLTAEGSIAMIMPTEDIPDMVNRLQSPLQITRQTIVKDSASKVSKRTLLQFGTDRSICNHVDTLLIRDETGGYSPNYTTLCKDFYLKFC